MADSNNSNCGQINTDVSGVGVRVSLYASVTIGLIMMRWFTHDMEAFQEAARASFITSIAVLISALVSLYGQNGLALVDGLVVTVVTSLVMAYAWIVGSQGTGYAQSLGGNKFELTWTLTGTAILHTGLWMAFGCIVWWNPASFGGDAIQGCIPNPNDDAVFWLFGHSVWVSNTRLRRFAIFSFFAGGLISIGWTCIGFWYTRRSKKEVEEKNIDILAALSAPPPPDGGSLPLVELPSFNAPHQPADVHEAAPESGEPPARTILLDPEAQLNDTPEGAHQDLGGRWKRAPVRTLYPIWNYTSAWGGIGAYIYLIVTTESLITANGQRAATLQLTFGQIFSLVLLLDQIIFQPMTQMFNSLLERAFQKQKQERKREQDRQASVRNGDARKRIEAPGSSIKSPTTGVTAAQQIAQEVRANP